MFLIGPKQCPKAVFVKTIVYLLKSYTEEVSVWLKPLGQDLYPRDQVM